MNQHRCYGCMQMITEEVCPHCGYSAHQNNEPNQLPVGTLLRDQYLVGRVLGQGGFGITYIGWDTYLDEPVAIKEFFPSSVVNRDITYTHSVRVNTSSAEKLYINSRDRFLREAKTMAKLRHVSQIVDIMGFFPANNTAYIIMEYVKGIDLRHFVRQQGGKVSASVLFPILEPVVLALESVHQAGLVHRDISPDNIMLQPDGTPKLLDFGAVRDTGSDDADIDLSHSTEAILKHGFAPVEQYRARGNLGPWTDEYGFCASVYYCMTGKVPPDALTRMTDDVQPDWDSIPGLTRNQRSALEKGMSIRAKDRFGSMKELHSALYGTYSIPAAQAFTKDTADPPVIIYDAPKSRSQTMSASVSESKPTPAKKKNILPLIAGIAVAAAVMIGIGVWVGGIRPDTNASLSIPTTAPETISDDASELAESEATIVSIVEPWEANILKSNPLSPWTDKKTSIQSVTFLDTLESAPEHAVDVSADGSGSVLGWLTDNNLFFAANNGINARDCCPGLFEGCTNLTTVTFGSAFHTGQASSMEKMFAGCLKLEALDTTSLDTGNVVSMQQMFDMRTIVENPDGSLSYKVTISPVLKSLDLSSWDISNVKSMAGMFSNCSSLQTLDLHGWDVSNVRLMNSMFGYCSKLRTLETSHWNVSNVSNMNYMFVNCESLNSLDVSNWDVSGLRSMNYTFAHCEKLPLLDVSHWDVSNVNFMDYAFAYCSSLETLDVGQWDVSQVLSMSNTFAFCSGLQTLDVSTWDVSNVRNMTCMFSGIRWNFLPDVSNWNVSRVEKYDSFFSDGRSIHGMRWALFFPEQPLRDSGSGTFSIDVTELTVPLYDSCRIELQGNVSPADVNWSSSNAEVADISKAGIITTFHPGTAVITASYANRTVTITVHVP